MALGLTDLLWIGAKNIRLSLRSTLWLNVYTGQQKHRACHKRFTSTSKQLATLPTQRAVIFQNAIPLACCPTSTLPTFTSDLRS
jgi:hypothetical protein